MTAVTAGAHTAVIQESITKTVTPTVQAEILIQSGKAAHTDTAVIVVGFTVTDTGAVHGVVGFQTGEAADAISAIIRVCLAETVTVTVLIRIIDMARCAAGADAAGIQHSRTAAGSRKT